MLKKRFKKAFFLFLIVLLFLISAATSLNLHNKSHELLLWNERSLGRVIVQLVILQQAYISILIKLKYEDIADDDLMSAYDLTWSAYDILFERSKNTYFVKNDLRLIKLKQYFLVFKESIPLKAELSGDQLTSALRDAQQAHRYSVELLNSEYQGNAQQTQLRNVELVYLNKIMIISLLGLTASGGFFLFIILRERHQMAYLAYHDPLTSIGNRSAIKEEITLLQHEHADFCAILIDIDGFKSINDSFGHDIGDKLLITLTLKMSEVCGDKNFVGRLGGDEFAVVYTAKGSVEQIVMKLLDITKSPIEIEGCQCDVGLSIGISHSQHKHRSWVDILKEADNAMYQAKVNGGNQYHIYNDITEC